MNLKCEPSPIIGDPNAAASLVDAPDHVYFSAGDGNIAWEYLSVLAPDPLPDQWHVLESADGTHFSDFGSRIDAGDPWLAADAAPTSGFWYKVFGETYAGGRVTYDSPAYLYVTDPPPDPVPVVTVIDDATATVTASWTYSGANPGNWLLVRWNPITQAIIGLYASYPGDNRNLTYGGDTTNPPTGWYFLVGTAADPQDWDALGRPESTERSAVFHVTQPGYDEPVY